ncbi:MAG TPA: hypothetical protein VFO16_02280 [Pseudonocardiaceae bacterium]|nr:hypothetical protein [Pseudonocardiaceae bacterium]
MRVCAHVPPSASAADIAALRVLLVADLLARTGELGGLQVLTALQFSEPGANQAGLESDAGALGIHPAATRTSSNDAHSQLGGPVDVHLVSQSANLDPGQNEPSVCIAAAHLHGAESRPGPPAGGLLAGRSHDPLSVRLALMSIPSDLPADLTEDGLTRERDALADWRRQVAGWAESPSRPIPATITEAAGAAFVDLDTVAVLALLRGVSLDASVPAGAKFETFVYADRILGLDLARGVGQPVGEAHTQPGVASNPKIGELAVVR